MLRRAEQHGQAMTEFSVIAVTVLVPMFLMIPLLGKYIDMKQTSIQAARHIAWERTAWYERAPQQASGVNTRSSNRLQLYTARRVFSATDLPLNTATDSAGWRSNDSNPLWTDHAGNALTRRNYIGPRQGNEQQTPDPSGVFLTMVNQYNRGVGTINSLLRPLSVLPANFLEIYGSTNAYYTPQINFRVENIISLPAFANLDLNMRGQSALLADGWNVQDEMHFADVSRRYVPSAVLQNPAFDFVLSTLAATPLAPEFNRLNFGYLGTDPIAGSGAAIDCNTLNACQF